MSTTLVRVDDSDVSSIQYSNDPGWFAAGSANEFNHTTHGTRNAGATATFVFNGTFVQVYGTIPAAGTSGDPDPVSTFSIDAGSSATFAPTPGRDDVFQQVMFQSADLQAAEHTLVINSTIDLSWFWLDYIVYTPLEEEDVSRSLSPSSSASATRTATSTSTVAVSSSKSSAPPAIIGGTLGGLAALVVLGCLIGFLCYRSRRLKRRSTLAHEHSRGAPTPFMLESAYVPPPKSLSAYHTITLPSESGIAATGEYQNPPSYQATVGLH
ncbi:hypothetical protein BDZ89DRAFT_1083191 [Hymenopellis radicata]|nr:hypothetical protein BDZ89DRAFT_1083191 [Hymenopellis radicata]